MSSRMATAARALLFLAVGCIITLVIVEGVTSCKADTQRNGYSDSDVIRLRNKDYPGGEQGAQFAIYLRSNGEPYVQYYVAKGTYRDPNSNRVKRGPHFKTNVRLYDLLHVMRQEEDKTDPRLIGSGSGDGLIGGLIGDGNPSESEDSDAPDNSTEGKTDSVKVPLGLSAESATGLVN